MLQVLSALRKFYLLLRSNWSIKLAYLQVHYDDVHLFSMFCIIVTWN